MKSIYWEFKLFKYIKFNWYKMEEILPIRYTQAYSLTDLGLSKDLFKPGNLGFESEKYISMKEGGVSWTKFLTFLI